MPEVQGWMIRWFINIAALLLTAALLEGFQVSIWGAIVGSVMLGIVNAVIRPICLLITLPLNILTLGLFTFVINASMLSITAATIKGFDLVSFPWALLTAIVLSLISFFVSLVIKN